MLFQIQEGAEHRRNFPRLRTGRNRRAVGVPERRRLAEAGETPPTSFSSLLRPRLSARPRRLPEGWAAPESGAGKGPAAVIRRGVRVFFREKEKQGKVRLQPDERAPPG